MTTKLGKRRPPGSVAWLSAAFLLAVPAAADADPHAERAAAIRAAAAAAEPLVVQLRHSGGDVASAIASGVRIAPGGWIVASGHGLDPAPAATVVTYADGRRSAAALVARDHHRSLALFRASDPPDGFLSPVVGAGVRPGQTAIAVGRGLREGGVHLAVGVVSAGGRFGGKAVQTDAAVSPLNYGGLLVNLSGRAIGVVTPLAPEGVAGDAWYDAGVGFAVPLAAVIERLPAMQAGADVFAGELGVGFATESPLLELPVIESLAAGGAAERAGLAVGDVITSVGGVGVRTVAQTKRTLAGRDAGERVEIGFSRGADAARVAVATLGRRGVRPHARGD